MPKIIDLPFDRAPKPRVETGFLIVHPQWGWAVEPQLFKTAEAAHAHIRKVYEAPQDFAVVHGSVTFAVLPQPQPFVATAYPHPEEPQS
jgi:hypothetical protein